MEYLGLGGLGLLVGFIAGFFGIGGGTVLVPTLVFFGFGIKSAIAISIMQMVFSSAFGSWVNYKNGYLEIKDGLMIGLGGLVGAFFSGFVVKSIPEWILELIFCVALAFSIYRFFGAPLEVEGKENKNTLLLFILGLSIGLIAMSLGIGGALFLTPILVGFLNYDMKKAISIGLFFVVFSSSSGFISMAYNGLVNYTYGAIIGFISLFGVYFGVKQSHKIHKALQKKLLLLLYTILLLLMLKELLGI